MTLAIEVHKLGKRYCIGQEQAVMYRTLRESLVQAARGMGARWGGGGGRNGASTTDFWALKDVGFDVKPGEVLGVIGRNGAGKSTLLKIISRITRPTTGEARMHGRVGSLLEVGTGFHPELTGRENVYLNGAILGMHRAEIKRKFDEIVAFAGVEQFLDMPIKRYSSGMYVRLAFAVAAHLDPEILLVDEVLAVGDQAFQKKCIGRMGDIASGGRTILLVSHDLPMLSRLSTRALWLHQGKVEMCGAPQDVIAAYCDSINMLTGTSAVVELTEHEGRRPGMTPMLQRLSLLDNANRPTTSVQVGGTLAVELQLGGFEAQSDTTVMVHVCDIFGTSLGLVHSKIQGSIDLGGAREATVRCYLEDLRLLPGEYTLSVSTGDSENTLDRIDYAIGFTVIPADVYGTGKLPHRKHGPMVMPARWQVEDMRGAAMVGEKVGGGV